MKEHGILFKGPMVRAIVAGTKFQTRRLAYVRTKHLKSACIDRRFPPDYGRGEFPNVGVDEAWTFSQWTKAKAGELMWVKETWRQHEQAIHYRADDLMLPARICEPQERAMFADRWKLNHHGLKWKSSMFMPRKWSRLLLRITAVRVERLQAISRADAIAEGLTWVGDGCTPYGIPGLTSTWNVNPRASYRELWKLINGEKSWDENPWVVALTFERVANG